MIVEMTWMETCQLLGLDVLALMLMALALLDAAGRALRSAWATMRARRPGEPSSVGVAAMCAGSIRHV
jgi:hypothetical protein